MFFMLWQALLQDGATVVAPVRSEKGRELLEDDVAGVSTDKLDVRSPLKTASRVQHARILVR